MRIPIRNKLIATYLFISVLTALVIYLLIYFTSEQRVNMLTRDYQLKEMSQEVYHWYAAEQNWEGFPDYFKTLHPPPPKGERAKEEEGVSKRHGLVTGERKALMRYLNFMPGDVIPEAHLSDATPVVYKGETIAWIIPPEVVGISLNSEMQVFLDNTQDVLLIAIAISILISLLMGILLAKIALKPVESLTLASSAIASGELRQQVHTYADDEIGDLSRSFNNMSQDLVKADKQRRQLTADITHDLGTPVQVISGYVEMAQECGLELNSERVDIISSELEHIRRLLNDMSLLAKTDAKTLSLYLAPTSIKPLLQRIVRLYQQPCGEQKIKLALELAEMLPVIELDEERMVQVLGNLISNAIRYTPEGGGIKVEAYSDGSLLSLVVADNGCGIQAEDLPFIFDRFYRSDNSRAGTSGKMGLGLSISQGLVEMQGGGIRVESDGISGSRFIIEFPLG